MKLGHLICKALSGRIILVALAILFTLCIGTANSAPAPGTVTILLYAEPENLDPGNISSSIEGQVLTRNVYETLTELNPADSSIMPRLATSWKQIDATTWHFFLRKGVKFHDGTDFNAAAMLFNFKRLYNKDIPSRARAREFGDVNMTGKALDSHTLEIKLEKPEPVLPTVLATLAICSPKTAMAVTRAPVGSGPYKFVKWDAGTQIVLERFDGYWGKQPQVKKAVFEWRSESAVRATMVALGEADLAPQIAVQEANRPDLDKSYFNSDVSFLRFFPEWQEVPPFTDRRVRMALCYALDLNAIRGSILSKDMEPATQIIMPSVFGYNPDLKPWPYDPEKAKQLLDEARKDGVPVDKEITVVGRLGWFPGVEELSEAIWSMYKAVGLNVKLKMMEKGQFRIYTRRPYPTDLGPYLGVKTHDNNKGDAAFSLRFNYHCKGNVGSMCDKTVDDLIERAEVATGEGRKSLWQAAFKRIHEEIIPEVPLFYHVAYCRVGKRINYKPTPAMTTEIQVAQITFR